MSEIGIGGGLLVGGGLICVLVLLFRTPGGLKGSDRATMAVGLLIFLLGLSMVINEVSLGL